MADAAFHFCVLNTAAVVAFLNFVRGVGRMDSVNGTETCRSNPGEIFDRAKEQVVKA